MKLDEINALKAFSYDELIDRLHVEGGSFAAVVKALKGGPPTKDSLRLAIIDRVIARELDDDVDPDRPPSPSDPGQATN